MWSKFILEALINYMFGHIKILTTKKNLIQESSFLQKKRKRNKVKTLDAEFQHFLFFSFLSNQTESKTREREKKKTLHGQKADAN